MMKVITAVAIAGLALAVTVAPQPAQARGGALAAGIIGGLAVGAIVGSQYNGYYGGPGYYGPGYYLSLIHISEPTRQAEISYAVFCLKKKKKKQKKNQN